ncbi:type III polyketide synthase [Afifella pfennigii]|uniref:type III polyketide synthase n=1 Tax=Afifella pfennigii TaxID=209897 RepID=UPI00047C777B|nr:type III polyketide synthase [Afifella pfennigii]
MPEVYINRIATAVPHHDVHRFFLDFAAAQLKEDPRQRRIFARMAERSGIRHRYSCLAPAEDPRGPHADRGGIFSRGAFPGTAQRMEIYERHAPELAVAAIERLNLEGEREHITHLIVTSCTGFSAPGIDLEIVARCGLSPAVERTIVGFMGCYAAINALKLARHIIRSEPAARVLVVNVELCTLHLKDTTKVEDLLSFCLWGDGCAASLVSADPVGLRLDGFRTFLAPDSRELMTWHVRDDGFDMVLSGRVPSVIHRTLGQHRESLFGERNGEAITLWAVHPGGRSVLDAVERALALKPGALAPSRQILRDNGNMSSATVMFVMEKMLGQAAGGTHGCGMAFGPGLTAETMRFEAVGRAA